MFIDFFFKVKQAKIPATIREWLMLVEAMEKNLVMYSIDDFYYPVSYTHLTLPTTEAV